MCNYQLVNLFIIDSHFLKLQKFLKKCSLSPIEANNLILKLKSGFEKVFEIKNRKVQKVMHFQFQNVDDIFVSYLLRYTKYVMKPDEYALQVYKNISGRLLT